MKHAEIHLGYFKQGDDLASCLKKTGSTSQAFLTLAEQLSSVSQQLSAIGLNVDDSVEIEADCHYISIYGSDEIINTLIQRGLAVEVEYEEI